MIFSYNRKDLGPTPFPIVGNLISLFINFPGYDVFKKWTQQYGPVHTVWFSEMPMVMITDYALIIENFQKQGDVFAGRLYTDSFMKITRGLLTNLG